MMSGYAIVDVESTGVFAARDRIVEIAIVRMNPAGSIEDQWVSLVNPMRDLGPINIHGISAADVRCAPTFADLRGEILDRLRGRVLVGHNVQFDARFIQAEFEHCGDAIPQLLPLSVCTQRLAPEFLSAGARSLAQCCADARVELINAHSAAADAGATAELFGYYLDRLGLTGFDPVTAWRIPVSWEAAKQEAEIACWPPSPEERCAPVTRGEAVRRHQPLLSRIAQNVHAPPGDTATASYFRALTAALLDRQLSERESDRLVKLAASCGLDAGDVTRIHFLYLVALAREALADGVVTKDEFDDLEHCAGLLELDSSTASMALTLVQAGFSSRSGASPNPNSPPVHSGDTVVFTGSMRLPRDQWKTRAVAAGFRVGASVTRQTALVVAADPDSLSGKAQKADKYGIPIVSEEAFSYWIGSSTRT